MFIVATIPLYTNSSQMFYSVSGCTGEEADEACFHSRISSLEAIGARCVRLGPSRLIAIPSPLSVPIFIYAFFILFAIVPIPT
jgi:hypothetical protein